MYKRQTVYCNDPYDLTKLNAYLAAMEKRGYVLADTEISVKDLIKRGYIPTNKELKDPSIEKIVPDLDIRLEDVNDRIADLPANLKYSIGKPQKSGYEDIQMRFIRNFDKKANPVQHELIVLFGPNYAHAKHNESTYVYKFLRLFDELQVNLENTEIGSHAHKAKRYIDLIMQMFRGKVSQKEFLIGKNKDYAGIDDEINISFSNADKDLFKNYFNGLNERVTSVYSALRKTATRSEKGKLTKAEKADKAILAEIKKGLTATIKHYNDQGKTKAVLDAPIA